MVYYELRDYEITKLRDFRKNTEGPILIRKLVIS
jgi:hypothetical protein